MLESEIRKEAYLMWERAGKPDNMDQDFWNLAEQQVRRINKYPKGQVVKIGSETFTIKQWANRTGNPASTIRSRLKSGLPAEKAIFEKTKRQKNTKVRV